MSNPAEIDRRVKGTEYWALIDPKAPQQRTGVLGSLNMSADSFRLLPKEEEDNVSMDGDQMGRNAPEDGSSLPRAPPCARLSARSSACGSIRSFCAS